MPIDVTTLRDHTVAAVFLVTDYTLEDMRGTFTGDVKALGVKIGQYRVAALPPESHDGHALARAITDCAATREAAVFLQRQKDGLSLPDKVSAERADQLELEVEMSYMELTRLHKEAMRELEGRLMDSTLRFTAELNGTPTEPEGRYGLSDLSLGLVAEGTRTRSAGGLTLNLALDLGLDF